MGTRQPTTSKEPQESASDGQSYERYRLEPEKAPPIKEVPPRFEVDVGKWGLAKLLMRELLHYRGDLDVVKSRPCVYGVFDGPLGGFSPDEEKCVGCLRCTTQYPEFVDVRPNPDREAMGDEHLSPEKVATILSEAESGRVPVRGQGYRGRFGGEGWDGVWTDMSEIVRPTRDGIHGREFISTAVDIGSRPKRLDLGDEGRVLGPGPRTVRVGLPILFDAPPRSLLDGERGDALAAALAAAARETQGLAILPVDAVERLGATDPAVAPLVGLGQADRLASLPTSPDLVELTGLDPELHERVREACPDTVTMCRIPAGAPALEMIHEARSVGVDAVHLFADYHGRSPADRFLRDDLRLTHTNLVDDGFRDQTTIVASGGLVAAEHVPKAILAGADAVAIDTAAWIALQARLDGTTRDRETASLQLPEGLEANWGRQRLVNLLAAWRNQLLEVLGAMGLREVRRLRGEMGRAMDQDELELEAFGGIEGYPRPEGDDGT